MGAYLNKPVTEKKTESDGNDRIRFAATTMQGWRINQEDAHNCLVDFLDNWHLFAVYDGHGGAEVARYTAQHFPSFLKKKEFWKSDDIVKVLENTFVEFDDHLRSEEAMKELKILANGETKEASDGSGDEEEDAKLFEESTTPLEELLARYGYAIVRSTDASKTVKHITEIEAEHAAEAEAATVKLAIEKEGKSEDGEEGEGNSTGEKPQKRPNESPRLQRAKRAKSEKSENSGEEGEESVGNGEYSEKKTEEKSVGNGEETEKEKNGTSELNESSSGDKSEKRSKAVLVKETAKMCLPPSEEDGSSSDDDDYKENEDEDEENEDDEEEDEDEEEEGGEEDEQMTDDGFGGLSGASFGPTGETPGEDSGTTACVCLVAPGRLIVANAGDSRAVLCRGSTALDLSVDHKPEDEIEKERINRAGGVVNEDGRVNGGLNLSRALGDHCYKKNKNLSLRDQMISALPDVKMVDLKKEDEFVVIACDGIWNSLESQQVVDFVKTRIDKGMALSQICEEMCTECLADSTAGDGTGCDNMTVIIADLKPSRSIQVEATLPPPVSS